MRKYQVIIGVGIIIGVLVYLFVSSFSSAKMYYYTMDELAGLAIEPDKRIKISGALVENSVDYDPAGPRLQFVLRNSDDTFSMPVTYADAMPDNFMKSQEVVATGHLVEGTFVAESLLLKCPSKYEAEPKAER